MTRKRALLLAAALLVGGITLLHVLLNQGGAPLGKQAEAHRKFRVGHLPVT